MSTFKEPQPRKQPTDKANGFPPKVSTGESRVLADLEDWMKEASQTPIMAMPEHTNLEYRKAALEQSVAYYAGADRSEPEVLGLAVVFENYLRNGNQP